MCNTNEYNTLDTIYETLQQIDCSLANQNQNFVRSLVRMAHVSLAMAEYGVAYETSICSIETDMMVAALKGVKMAGGISPSSAKFDTKWQA